MKKLLAVTTLFSVAALPLWAQKVDKTPMTHQQGEEILQELRQIRQLLEKQQNTPPGQKQEEQPTRAKITDLSGVSMLGTEPAVG